MAKIFKAEGSARDIKPVKMPPFPFVGNKSNRRDVIVSTLKWAFGLSGSTTLYEPFGGSFYCSHLAYAAGASGTFINDYDNYSVLFSSYFMEHALFVKSVCDEYPELKRADKLPDEACQKIDNYIQAYCPDLDNWFVRLLTIFGVHRKYRKRLTDHQRFWKGVSLREYVGGSTIVSGKCDFREFIKLMSSRGMCPKDKPSVWLVDPPYAAYGVCYGDYMDNQNPDIVDIMRVLFDEFPNAMALAFSYTRNPGLGRPDFPDSLHYEELNEFFAQLRFIRHVNHPEYMQLWYSSDEFKGLARQGCPVESVTDPTNAREFGDMPEDYDPFVGER